ncbi:terminase family protein [Vibrio parahaemolyticus]|nr:terminase family protein [Vibrio parahaemolyticus]
MNRIKLEYLELLEEKARRIEYNAKYYKLSSFKPYKWQSDFMAASKKYKQRFLRAGNQTGKTKSQGMEFAQHLSGLYQPWYEGERIKESGHLFWCVGVDLDATADVMMNELFGCKDIRLEDQVGSGTIPKHCIDFNSFVKDGRRLISCRIKHKDGGYNTLQFFGAKQGHSRMMGARVKYAWIDEEPEHRSIEIYSQCVARTINTDGFVTITATPEAGRTPLNILFEEDESNELYLQQVSWRDCPHIDEETERRLLASFPEYQWEMRRDGLPVIGHGAVFAFKDSEVSCDPVEIDNWDNILWAIDIGKTNDPTVIALGVKKIHNQGLEDEYETITIQSIFESDDDRSPMWVHSVISNHTYCNAPIILPHDAGDGVDGSAGYGSILKRLGLNVHPEPFSNPVITSSNVVNPTPTHCRSIEAGLYYMEQFFKEQKLKISKTCHSWFKEKAGYYRTGKTGLNAYAGSDHSIDASRYAFMSLLGHKGIPAGQCQKTNEDWNNGFHSYEENVAKELAQFY